ncbi:hypothetical protein C5708_09530 [Caulobacter sp. CCUG 60055]|uniref:ATP-binding protein n=1 Tax=Caulobacter sp. CCUG 60055 TaxID=2100090 RepID=UPI001FA784CC|nr:ATP-binding protein [Caulobacter sp. CCUG 60055]MBQ1544046.1 sensor histidine kinase N-terminal domain-containing protein [Caulobacteraceae bacterium]MCI3180495.1 hypothetical protein [Caulobacter sp. CCUG 60055]
MKNLIRRSSLIGTLFRQVTGLLAAITLVVGAMAFWTAKDQINDVYDSQLIIGASVLHALMREELQVFDTERRAGRRVEVDDTPLLSADDREAFDAYADWRMFRIWSGSELVLGSDTGPSVKTPSKATEAFQTVIYEGQAWRVYTLPLPSEDVVIQVGERLSIRNVLIQKIALELAVPLLLLIPGSLALIWLSLTDGLRALRNLVREISRRGQRDLTPVPVDNWPTDLQPLVRSINLLFTRLDRAFQQERRFVEHAAHQLRTPLAALRLQAQLILREDDPAEREAQVEQLREGVDRAIALMEQLLTLARLDADAGAAGEVDLRAECAAAIADCALVAASRDVRLALEGAAPPVRGDATAIRLILSNLLENAVNHAPPDSEIDIRLSEGEGVSIVAVSDLGPGVPEAERQKVFERFYRGPGAQGRGAGLGLAIVGEAARVLGAVVTLGERADGRPGLEAKVSLPRAEAVESPD